MDENWNMISTREAATILGVRPSTINGWVHRNKLPFPMYKINARCYRFKKTDVIAYLDKVKNG